MTLNDIGFRQQAELFDRVDRPVGARAEPTVAPMDALDDVLRPIMDAALPSYEKLLKYCQR